MSFKIDTTTVMPITIPDATANNDGVMTAAQVSQLDAASDGTGAYYWTAAKTWAQVWAEVQAGGLYGTIYIDNTTSTRTITAAEGPYDFTGIEFRGFNQTGPSSITSITFEAGTLIDAGSYVAFRATGPSVRFLASTALMTAGAAKRVVLEVRHGAFFGPSADVTIFNTGFAGVNSLVIDGRLNSNNNLTNPVFYINNAAGSLQIFYLMLGPNNSGNTAFSSGALVAGGLAGSTAVFYGNPLTAGIYRSTAFVAPLTSTRAGGVLFFGNFAAAVNAANTDNKGEVYWDTVTTGPRISDGTSYLDFLVQSQSATKTGAYNALKNELVLCNPTGGTFAVTLPAATGHRCYVTIKNVSASATAITISPTGGDTVDGAASGSITAGRGSRTYVSNGTSDWMLVATV